MKAFGRLLIKYRKEEEEGGKSKEQEDILDPAEKKKAKKEREKKAFRMEREDVANAFYERARQLIMGSDLSRLQAKLNLRKEMMRDYKDKFEKASSELNELKIQIN